jgi:MFS family permease
MFMHRYMMGQMRRIYFMALPESEKDMKSSRYYFIVADSAVQTIAQLIGGTFLATLMSYSGVSDANIGIITSLVSLAALSQLFLINFFKKIKKYKLLVTATALQRMLFAVIYLIPILMIGKTAASIFIVLLYFVGQVFVQIGSPASQDWIASLVPSRIRGNYFSTKDSIAVFVVSSMMLICGMVFDHYKSTGDMLTGFKIISAIIFLLTIINVVALSMMKEPKTSYVNASGKEMHGRLAKRAKEQETAPEVKSIVHEIKEAFQDHRFRKAFTVQCLFTLAFYICAPFNASYQINDLSLPYTFIMLVSFIFNLYRIFIMPRLGRLADKYGMSKLTRFSLLALGLNFLSASFMMPWNAYPMYILSTFFSSTAWAFLGIGLFGIQLDFFQNEKRMIWLTITSSLSGVFGFLVSIFAGTILDMLQHQNLHLLGTKIYAQQVLNLLGFLITLFAVFFIKRFLEPEIIDKNNTDGEIK